MPFHQAIGVQFRGGLPAGTTTRFPASITEFRPRSSGSELSLEEAQAIIRELGTGRSLEQSIRDLPLPSFRQIEEQIVRDKKKREKLIIGLGLAAAGTLVVWLLAR